MTKMTKMTKKQIVYFYTYIACIIIIPVVLSLIADSIPKNDSLSPSGHPFEFIDDRAFFIWLGLDLGLYLYPLHLIFINKTTLKISKSLFLPSIIFAILLPPAVLILSDASAREFFFIFMSYVGIAFVIPFLIIYYIKRKI